MLGTIYRMLVLNLGEPPTKFTWTRKDAKGNPVETKEYTPQSFFQEYIGDDLKNNYVMLMNDPSRDYYKRMRSITTATLRWQELDVRKPSDRGYQTNGYRFHQGQHHDVFLLRRGQVLRS